MLYRDFYEVTLQGLDIERIMTNPIFKVSENEMTQEGFVCRALPVMLTFIGTVLGHDRLQLTFPIPARKVHSHDFFYLERQYNAECWMHSLFALLGETLHPMFRFNNWIIAVMSSFTKFPIGTEPALEPTYLSDLGANQEFNEEMRNIFSNENTSKPKFCPGIYSKMHVTRHEMERFISAMEGNYSSFGTTKIFMHSVFSSLGNPNTNDDVDNVYQGCQHLLEEDVTYVEELIQHFERRCCNVIIFCCPISTTSTTILQHYVIVWLLRSSRTLVYYDPNKGGGIQVPSQSSDLVSNYRVPSCLLKTSRKEDKSIIYVGNKRCVFYFDMPLDHNGYLLQSARDKIACNLNERFYILLEDVFAIQNKNLKNIVSLDCRNHDPCAFMQTRRLAVRPSNLRSTSTGNTIGKGLFTKRDITISKDELIGSWSNGTVLVLTDAERELKRSSNPNWQFYSIRLELSRSKMESIRKEANLPVSEHENYIAELDNLQAATNGHCLLSFANSGRNVYHPHGCTVTHNAEFRIRKGSTTPALYATKDIPPGTEILWPYSSGIQLPTTAADEQFSRIGGNVYDNIWCYSFSRNSIIQSLTQFARLRNTEYLKATELVNNAVANIDSDTIIARHSTGKHGTLDILNVTISKCRLVPNERRTQNSKEKIPVS